METHCVWVNKRRIFRLCVNYFLNKDAPHFASAEGAARFRSGLEIAEFHKSRCGSECDPRRRQQANQASRGEPWRSGVRKAPSATRTDAARSKVDEIRGQST